MLVYTDVSSLQRLFHVAVMFEEIVFAKSPVVLLRGLSAKHNYYSLPFYDVSGSPQPDGNVWYGKGAGNATMKRSNVYFLYIKVYRFVIKAMRKTKCYTIRGTSRMLVACV
jgi:hypothetical protein